jgi:hypothetical protein
MDYYLQMRKVEKDEAKAALERTLQSLKRSLTNIATNTPSYKSLMEEGKSVEVTFEDGHYYFICPVPSCRKKHIFSIRDGSPATSNFNTSHINKKKNKK